MAVYVGVAVICLFLGLIIGGSKGFAGTGAILSLLLGPLGVLIVACMKPTPQVQAQREQAVEVERAKLRAQQTTAPTIDTDPWEEAPNRHR